MAWPIGGPFLRRPGDRGVVAMASEGPSAWRRRFVHSTAMRFFPQQHGYEVHGNASLPDSFG